MKSVVQGIYCFIYTDRPRSWPLHRNKPKCLAYLFPLFVTSYPEFNRDQRMHCPSLSHSLTNDILRKSRGILAAQNMRRGPITHIS
jgi:hypothetical protein